ncbi:MAG: UDP-N-acetylmuramoyl-L-alanine--D-glutamate ligase [Oscillospiraceae bacterium]|nr:UDP-N-acetylmuramoyl-L-alanine--D-glutamate ligase [Oscillospiraceae bacterium]
MTKVQKFFKEIQNKKVAFIGTGVTNTDIIKLFLAKKIDVTICDRKSAEQMGDLYSELENLGAKYIMGEKYLDSLTDFDIVFRSPGVYFNNEKLQDAIKNGVAVTSEMEVFFDICPCKIYAVTGSDGKTTTTTIISELFKSEGKRVHLGGNIGKALLPIIEEINEDDIAVIELSSFQLLSMRQSPDVAVITNITPNHLNVHGTMEEYIYAKCNILNHQNAFSRTVLSYDNETTKNLNALVRGKLSYFSRFDKPYNGSFLNENNILCYNEYGNVTEVMNMNEIRIPGMHNVENYLTAISAVWGEVSIKNIRKIAKEFGGVEHRIEFVREINGAKYYNNSIASSPTRVLACLNSFDEKQIMIQGGSDKGISFEPMADAICEKVRVLILMGETKYKIRDAVTASKKYNPESTQIIIVEDMQEAVNTAYKYAKKGDIVSLSPACASFDMYRMFEDRGRHFKQLVNAL